MIYALRIIAETSRNVTERQHSPVVVETITNSKEIITEEELRMVAEAFKAQIYGLLVCMTGRK